MRLFVTLTFAILLSACGDDIQFRDPPQKPASSGATRGGVQNIETHGDVSGGEDPFADPEDSGAGAGGNPAAAGAKTLFTGRVELAKGLTLPPRYTVYVMAYVDGTRMPVCVKRFDRPKFPMPFVLTTKDIMGGTPPAGSKMNLGAIISEGGGVTAAPGTFFVKSVTRDAYSPGATDAVITVSR